MVPLQNSFEDMGTFIGGSYLITIFNSQCFLSSLDPPLRTLIHDDNTCHNQLYYSC